MLNLNDMLVCSLMYLIMALLFPAITVFNKIRRFLFIFQDKHDAKVHTCTFSI
jgi:hypothetical protein